MSMFRPPQVPQQPRIFATPGQAPGAVPPVAPSQAAAYFRQRQEIQQGQQFNVASAAIPFVPAPALQIPAQRRDAPPIIGTQRTSTDTPGIVPPVAPDQRAAYFRPLPPVLQIAYPLTAVDQPGAVPPVAPSQAAAYFRFPLPPVLQITVNATPGAAPAPQVPPPPLQIPGPGLRSMIIEIEETLPFYTAPPPAPFVPSAPIATPIRSDRPMTIELEHVVPRLALTQAPGIVPAQPPDQRAAYFRRSPDSIQLTVAYVSTPPLPFVPALPLQSPAPGTRAMTAELAAARGFAVSMPAPIVPAAPLQAWQPAPRSMIAELAAAYRRFYVVAPLPLAVTPGARIFTVKIEPTHFSAAEARLFNADAEPRIFMVADESRTFAAHAEPRQVKGTLQ